jgi:isoleucyl-tRNA synthetase
VDHPGQPDDQPQPGSDYALVDTARGLLVLAPPGRDVHEPLGARWQVIAARAARRARVRHPLCSVDAGYKPVYLADYATADDGTGLVHSSPAYGVEDFSSCIAHSVAYDDILNPVGQQLVCARLPLFGGQHLEAVPVIIRRCACRPR